MCVIERIEKLGLTCTNSVIGKTVSLSDLEKILELAKLGQQMQWVSVHEQLPGHMQKVDIFATLSVNKVRICNVSFLKGDEDFGDHFYDWDFDNIYKVDEVSHWMTRPADPKGE